MTEETAASAPTAKEPHSILGSLMLTTLMEHLCILNRVARPHCWGPAL